MLADMQQVAGRIEEIESDHFYLAINHDDEKCLS